VENVTEATADVSDPAECGIIGEASSVVFNVSRDDLISVSLIMDLLTLKPLLAIGLVVILLAGPTPGLQPIFAS